MWNHPGISSHSNNLRRIRQRFWCINTMMLGNTVRNPSRSRPHILGAHSGQIVSRWWQFWGSCIPHLCTQPISILKTFIWLNSCLPLLPVYFHICSELILLLIISASFLKMSVSLRQRPRGHVYQQESQVPATGNSLVDYSYWVNIHFPQTLEASEESPRARVEVWGFNSPFISINSCFNLRWGPISMVTWDCYCL